MNAASQVPSGVLISTSVSTTDAAAAVVTAAKPAATEVTKPRRGRSRDWSFCRGSTVASDMGNLSSVCKYIFFSATQRSGKLLRGGEECGEADRFAQKK